MNQLAATDERKVSLLVAPEIDGYPGNAPFDPDANYPEFNGQVPSGDEDNAVYSLVRQFFTKHGFDSTRVGTTSWNPLGELISPGAKVLIKPNLVRHLHMGGGKLQCVITHPSVIRVVLDYVGLALKGAGEIIVGDAPVQGADFSTIMLLTKLPEICKAASERWRVSVRVEDLRLVAATLDEGLRIDEKLALKGDSAGYVGVDLGRKSLLTPIAGDSEKFRVTCYDCKKMAEHHNAKVNEYLISKSVLDADVIINLPKLKTHRKVGLTCGLKNLVGINGHKDWLPHHRSGSISEGGDEYLYPSVLKRFKSRLGELSASANPTMSSKYSLASNIFGRFSSRLSRDTFTEGSWYGNDTLWRTVLDLNCILLYADSDGNLQTERQRKMLTIVDAIVAGEGEGPMSPDSAMCSMIAGGISPVAVDTVLARAIGFDHSKIPIIANAYGEMAFPLVDFRPSDIVIEKQTETSTFDELEALFNFNPPSGWKGHIERDSAE